MAIWIPAYWHFNGPANFLWFCDVANFIVLVALWRESRLLFSTAAVGVLLIQVIWIVDFASALLTGSHLVGGTEYMFDAADPLWLRGCSLFHVWVPALIVWGLVRFGYDRRAAWLQSALALVVLPASFFAAPPEKNLNWLWAPFGVEQTLMPPWLWLLASLLLYPLVLFFPTHFALAAWAKRRGRLH